MADGSRRGFDWTGPGWAFMGAALAAGLWFGGGLLRAAPLATTPIAGTPPSAGASAVLPSAAAPPAVDSLLSYQKEVAAEEEQHEQFLERMDSKLEDDAIKFATAALGIIAAIFTFLEVQTRSSVRKNVEEKVDELAKAATAAELLKFQANIAALTLERTAELDRFQQEQAEQITLEIGALSTGFKRQMRLQLEITGIVSESVVLLENLLPPVGGESFEQRNASLPGRQQNDLERAFKRIERKLENVDVSRTLAIPLARFCAEFRGNVDAAIAVLENTLSQRDKRRRERGASPNAAAEAIASGLAPLPDEDDAAILYNLACYWNRQRLQLPAEQASAAGVLKNKAQVAITESIKLDPWNAREAKNDNDLKGLVVL